MRNRCGNPNVPCYARYGGRGIKVCDRWLESFENFYADMGPRPSSKHSIDRIDNDGNYEPNNCRWVTKGIQNRNTSKNVWLTLNGTTRCIADWAPRVGLSPKQIEHRVKLGWPDERILTEPVRTRLQREYTYAGRSLTLRDWARELGVSFYTLSARLTYGWSIERTLSTPLCHAGGNHSVTPSSNKL
jgi:hypothetical protein